MPKTGTFSTRNDLAAATRGKMAALLNQQLADTFDLYSQIKQAHWNVKGPQFIALHELFDKLAEGVLEHVHLYVGDNVRLLGGLPELREKYNFDDKAVYTQESFAKFATTGNPGDLVQRTFDDYKPETANSFEAGYKGLFNNRILVDVYGYFSKYKDFLTRTVVIQDGSTDAIPFDTLNFYSVAVNSPTTVDISGWGASIEYQMDGNYFIRANAFGDHINNVPTGFKSYFNTPEIRFNLGFGNSGFGKDDRLGFNIVYRWQDGYFTESDFRQGDVPSYGTLDAQVSYKFPKPKILLKLGGTNITNHYYITQFGNPSIGGLYYLSIGYNVF